MRKIIVALPLLLALPSLAFASVSITPNPAQITDSVTTALGSPVSGDTKVALFAPDGSLVTPYFNDITTSPDFQTYFATGGSAEQNLGYCGDSNTGFPGDGYGGFCGDGAPPGFPGDGYGGYAGDGYPAYIPAVPGTPLTVTGTYHAVEYEFSGDGYNLCANNAYVPTYSSCKGSSGYDGVDVPFYVGVSAPPPPVTGFSFMRPSDNTAQASGAILAGITSTELGQAIFLTFIAASVFIAFYVIEQIIMFFGRRNRARRGIEY